jgi:hypothetical protein
VLCRAVIAFRIVGKYGGVPALGAALVLPNQPRNTILKVRAITVLSRCPIFAKDIIVVSQLKFADLPLSHPDRARKTITLAAS